eukprot:RCo026021
MGAAVEQQALQPDVGVLPVGALLQGQEAVGLRGGPINGGEHCGGQLHLQTPEPVAVHGISYMQHLRQSHVHPAGQQEHHIGPERVQSKAVGVQPDGGIATRPVRHQDDADVPDLQPVPDLPQNGGRGWSKGHCGRPGDGRDCLIDPQRVEELQGAVDRSELQHRSLGPDLRRIAPSAVGLTEPLPITVVVAVSVEEGKGLLRDGAHGLPVGLPAAPNGDVWGERHTLRHSEQLRGHHDRVRAQHQTRGVGQHGDHVQHHGARGEVDADLAQGRVLHQHVRVAACDGQGSGGAVPGVVPGHLEVNVVQHEGEPGGQPGADLHEAVASLPRPAFGHRQHHQPPGKSKDPAAALLVISHVHSKPRVRVDGNHTVGDLREEYSAGHGYFPVVEVELVGVDVHQQPQQDQGQHGRQEGHDGAGAGVARVVLGGHLHYRGQRGEPVQRGPLEGRDLQRLHPLVQFEVIRPLGSVAVAPRSGSTVRLPPHHEPPAAELLRHSPRAALPAVLILPQPVRATPHHVPYPERRALGIGDQSLLADGADHRLAA